MPRTVLVIAALVVVGLLLVANEYGFHRDELYFIVAGRHPAWGYDDQPPLTPILSAAGVAVFGVQPFAARVLPALVAGITTLLGAAMAREMGGGRRAQEVAALTLGLSGVMLAGHLASTATYDLLAWALIAWLVARILRGADPRLWLAAGAVAGAALLNKYTVAVLLAALVLGIALERRWRIVASPWPWIGGAIALALWAPNLMWQAARDFPQLEMARHIAAATGRENRETFAVLLALLAGPLLFWVPLLGLGRLIASREARPWRPFAWAALAAVAVTYLQSGKAYYVMGLLPVLVAAGSIPLGAWLARGPALPRLAPFGAAAAISGAVLAVVTLPLVPPSLLVSSGVHDINNEHGEQIGWPELAARVDAIVDGLAPDERAYAIAITSNYGEAGAIELLSTRAVRAYSGHNSYWDWGPPPDDARVAIVIGAARTPGLTECTPVASVTNAFGIPNEEQGAPVQVCRGMPRSWAEVWSSYGHLN